ncbi:Methyltransferase domain protein [Anatilimnocola aggregata]|uniref:Methyltransferase domain protein n=1 Tax=Anatilimnocola aggregata TaxID=2528021 RepID=A0A517Y9P1_9BACT|nr:class I SAM-dependent methyltransferase [Anatilimnocola aggregata]QDU26949.1 Methyltransferase domain protein [Anatilimnocola aggregata]
MGKKNAYLASSLVSFRNSQGIEARGSLMRLSRQQAMFEIYNPYSIVQLSEVLSDLRIHQGEREVYKGRAVVTTLMNTGLMLIVSVSLVDPWSDLKGLRPGEVLRSFVHDFVADWEAGNERLHKPFQLSVGNLRNYLQEVSRWLEHWETEAGLHETTVSEDLQLNFVVDVDEGVAPRLGQLYQEFEETAKDISRKSLPYHRGYAQRELHPLMMCSPFMYRAFSKPLGYAGDYEMVRMMLSEPWEGGSSFAKILNASALRHDAPAAHRNRIKLLVDALRREAKRVASEGRRLRVLNIGCGPAVEISHFLEEDELANETEFTLVDFNTETLNFVRENLVPKARARRPNMKIEIEQRSVHEIIQTSMEGKQTEPPTYDLVYSAGLFDYFRDTTCGFLIQHFYSLLRPGGEVVVTNVTPRHSSEAIMSLVMEWTLELRDEKQMLALTPGLGRQEVYCDATSVNVFLSVRKP